MDFSKSEAPILLFDGVCNLCNGAVQWIILRDRSMQFRFAALQSETGQELLKKHGLLGKKLDSVVLIAGESAYIESSAALGVLRLLGFPWNIGLVFHLIPKFIRDPMYRYIARNRYRWFGKKETCMMPRPEWKTRFL